MRYNNTDMNVLDIHQHFIKKSIVYDLQNPHIIYSQIIHYYPTRASTNIGMVTPKIIITFTYSNASTV